MASRGRAFHCETTVSPGVAEKLQRNHNIEIWEIEEVINDDFDTFSITYRDCYFIYGQAFSGRYLLVLVRILDKEEIRKLGLDPDTNALKIITARDMNKNQRRQYLARKGTRR